MGRLVLKKGHCRRHRCKTPTGVSRTEIPFFLKKDMSLGEFDDVSIFTADDEAANSFYVWIANAIAFCPSRESPLTAITTRVESLANTIIWTEV